MADHPIHPTQRAKTILPITEKQLEAAYYWVCQQRQHYPANADNWDLRHHWHRTRHRLLSDIRTGDYQFSPVQRLRKADGETIHLWTARDSLVKKVLANHLSGQLKLSPACTHVKGHGGLKQSVVAVQQQLKHYQYVCKTDVKHYYAAIDHITLMNQIDQQIDNCLLRRYLWHIVSRTVEYGGTYRDITRGISRGCPLSPLFGALYLKELDEQFERNGLYYLRYMDNILILRKR